MKQVKWLCALLCAVYLCTVTVSAVVQSAVGAVAHFSYENTDAVPEDNIELCGYGDKDKGYNATQGDGDLYASVDGATYRKLEWTKDGYSGVGIQPAMTGGARHPWGEGAFLEVRLSTVGWHDLTFSARLGATNKGPRDFKLQYSLDGKTYTDVTDTVSLSDNKIMEQLFYEVTLPAETNNAEMLYLRMAVVGNETVGGEQGFIGTTSGEVAVNDVMVNGSYHRESATAGDTARFPWEWVAVGAAVVAVAVTAVLILIKRKKAYM